MKRPIILLAALLAAACTKRGVELTLSGSLPDCAGDTLRLVALPPHPDTLIRLPVAPDGTLACTLRAPAPRLLALTTSRGERLTDLCLEPGAARLHGSRGAGYRVSGTPANDAAAALERALDSLRLAAEGDYPALRSEERRIERLAFERNRENLLGATLLYRERTRLFDTLPPAALRGLLGNFPRSLRRSEPLASLYRTLEAVERSAPGRTAPELSLPDPDGERIALSSLTGQGRWVLVVFWASWERRFQRELPLLQRLQATYGPRGFTLYAVSLDNDTASWRRFLQRHALRWPNVHGVEHGATAPAAERYGVRALPANALVSPRGRIVARDLSAQQVERELRRIFE